MTEPKNPTTQAVRLLNTLLKADPEGLTALLGTKMPQPENLTEPSDFSLQPSKSGKKNLTVLGLINSILKASGNNPVLTITSEESVEVSGFADASILKLIPDTSTPVKPLSIPVPPPPKA